MTVIEFYKKSFAFRHYFGQFLKRWHILINYDFSAHEDIKDFQMERSLAEDELNNMRAVVLTYLYDYDLSCDDFSSLREFINYIDRKVWHL